MKITENAINEVLKVMKNKELNPNSNFLRISIKGVSCSGLNYGIEFTEKTNEDDVKLELSGLTIITDSKSAILLEDTTVDFLDKEDVRGFSFQSPPTSKGCGSGGCGCKCG